MLHLSDLNNTSLGERVDGLKRISFDEFLRLILILRRKYGIGESNKNSKSFDKNHDNQREITAFWQKMYLGPEKPIQQLRQIYEAGIQNLSSEGMEKFALDLYTTITLGQVFHEGNGRTAMILYNYLINGEFLSLSGSKENTFLSPHKNLLFTLSIKGVERIFRENGIIKETEELDEFNSWDSNKLSVKIKKDGGKLMGNEAFIAFLAFCDTLNLDYRRVFLSHQIWDLDLLFTRLETDKIAIFEDRFKHYSRLVFHEILAYVNDNIDEISSRVKGNIQGIITQK
ncbi:hypothetical protein KBD33_05435 [Candidatus Gracilibacteria bacterium]|nr:hypothetical protein [Candidatus Gracilibacteria bacterium]